MSTVGQVVPFDGPIGDAEELDNESHQQAAAVRDNKSGKTENAEQARDNEGEEKKDRYTTLLYALQVAATSVAFAIAYIVFRSEATVSLVPYSECGGCTTCEPQYTLSESNHMNILPLNVRVMEGQELSEQYQGILFSGTWESCGSSMASSFEFTPAKRAKSAYVMFPFNRSGLQQWDWANVTDGHVFYGAGDPQSVAGVAEQDKAEAVITGNFWGTTAADATSASSPVLTSTEPFKASSATCFRLQCSVTNSVNATVEEDVTEILVQNSTYRPYQVKVAAELVVIDRAVMASCTGVVYGHAFSYFSVSKAIVKEIAYLCTTETDWFNAASLSMSVANSVLGGTNLLKYVPLLRNMRNGFFAFISRAWFEIVG